MVYCNGDYNDGTGIKKITMYTIIEYLAGILKKFSIVNKFYEDAYFNSVFIKNLDIYGLLISYFEIFRNLFKTYRTLPENKRKLCNYLRDIFKRYLFENPVMVIDTQVLEQELLRINDYISALT